MTTHVAKGDVAHWAKRHRQQHAAFLKGKTQPLDNNVSRRLSSEFEHAVRQRGEQAKERAKTR